MSVISYRTKLDRRFLEKAAVRKLKYRSVNAFIDHAVETTLKDELGANTPAQKIVREIAHVVAKHYPLNFRAASAREEKEMLQDLEDLKSGKVRAIRASRAKFMKAMSRVGKNELAPEDHRHSLYEPADGKVSALSEKRAGYRTK